MFQQAEVVNYYREIFDMTKNAEYPGALDREFVFPKGDPGVTVVRLSAVLADLGLEPMPGLVKIISVANSIDSAGEPDGGLYVCGYFGPFEGPRTHDYFIVRITSDTVPDRVFGLKLGQQSDDLLGQPMWRFISDENNGFIMLGGVGTKTLSFGRLLHDCSPDPDFAKQSGAATKKAPRPGFLQWDLPEQYSEFAGRLGRVANFALAKDGFVVAVNAGRASRTSGLVYRVTLDGQLVNGVFDLRSNIDVEEDFIVEITTLASQGEKTIVGGCYYQPVGDYVGLLARVNQDGTLDRTFGDRGDGIYRFQPKDQGVSIRHLVIQDNGSILAMGNLFHKKEGPVSGKTFIQSFQVDGEPGDFFDSVTVDNDCPWEDAFITGDGNLMAWGTGAQDSCLARYLLPGGQLDKTFGEKGNGYQYHPGGGGSLPAKMIEQKGGKLVVGCNNSMEPGLGANMGSMRRYFGGTA
ncbi:hypothetical protein BWR59_08035 [Pseudomonas sp. Bc-h]|jgi:hypothetical protein|nr:hypothetical protein BWR59_08035 [Pseudomonas sp. Bc-h]